MGLGMMEKSWAKVGPIALLADGNADGLVVIPSTIGFYVKQDVFLANNPSDATPLQVKAVLSDTQLIVGARGSSFEPADISAYLAGATITAEKQSRPAIPEKEFNRAVFAEEPAVALRSLLVDRLGRHYSLDNPVPVELSEGSVNIGTVNAELEVALNHRDGDPDAGDVADSVRIGDGVQEWQMNEEGEGLTHDQDTHDRLDLILAGLTNEADEVKVKIENIHIRQAETNDKIDELIAAVETESSEIQSLLQSESDATQNLLQTEFDATQTLLQSEFDATQTLLQTEFDQTQVKLDNIHTRQLDKTQFTKLTDGTNDGIIDSDRNLHVENHGNKPDGSDVVQKLSETGETAIDGTYDGVNNTNPANIGMVTQERNVTAADSRQIMKPTSKRGTVNTDTVSIDVSLHDDKGNAYDEYNPLPTVPSDDMLDAFGRGRVSHQNVFFYEHFSDSQHAENWAQRLLGAGTVTWQQAFARRKLTVGTASGDQATVQSRRHFQYLPGQSLLAIFTGVLPAPKTGVNASMGLMDDNDGVFFRCVSTGMEVVKRSSSTGSPVETIVQRDNWSRDKLDGTGPSGVTVDFTKGQIFVIDLEWLGYGSVRFGIFWKGRIIYFHEFAHSNELSSAYMQRGSLPIRFSIRNTATSASSTDLMMGCVSLAGEGEVKVGKSIGVASTAATARTATTTPSAIIGIRLHPTYSKSEIEPRAFSLYSSSQVAEFYYEILINPTVTGAVWTDISESIGQQDVSGSVVTGGKRISAGYIIGKQALSALESIATSYRMGTDINGVPDTVYVVIRTLSGNSTIFATLEFKEIF